MIAIKDREKREEGSYQLWIQDQVEVGFLRVRASMEDLRLSGTKSLFQCDKISFTRTLLTSFHDLLSHLRLLSINELYYNLKMATSRSRFRESCRTSGRKLEIFGKRNRFSSEH